MRFRPLVLALTVVAGAGCARYTWVNELAVPRMCPREVTERTGAFAVDTAPAAAEPAGRVAGRVVGGAGPDTGGTPLQEARVIMRATADTTRVAVAVTPNDGRFAFDTVPAGRYTVNVRRIGYAQRRDTLDVPAGAGVRVRVRLARRGLDGPCSGFFVVRVRKPWWRFW